MKMSLIMKIFATVMCCILVTSHLGLAKAFSVSRTKRDLQYPVLTLEVLEGLVDDLKDQITNQQQKRRIDAGYGGRYGVAHSVGSKLMALKQAADWNGPGKK